MPAAGARRGRGTRAALPALPGLLYQRLPGLRLSGASIHPHSRSAARVVLHTFTRREGGRGKDGQYRPVDQAGDGSDAGREFPVCEGSVPTGTESVCGRSTLAWRRDAQHGEGVERTGARGRSPPLPRTTPHSLRRTYISVALLANKFDVLWVMRQVGHADSKMTMDVYAQLQQRADREHGQAFDALVRRAQERLYGTTAEMADGELIDPGRDPSA